MNSKEHEDYNSEELISIPHSLNAVNMWLNSGDVEISDQDGNVTTGYRINSKPGALLKRMLPHIACEQTK